MQFAAHPPHRTRRFRDSHLCRVCGLYVVVSQLYPSAKDHEKLETDQFPELWG